MTITCKNKIYRKCPSTSNKHVLICAPMSASPTSQFQFQYGNLCFQYTHIYIYILLPLRNCFSKFPIIPIGSFWNITLNLQTSNNHFGRFFCAVGVIVAVAGWLWLVVASWLLVVAACGWLMLVTVGWLLVVFGRRCLLVSWWLVVVAATLPRIGPPPSLRPSDLDVAGAKMAYCVAASLRKRKVRSWHSSMSMAAAILFQKNRWPSGSW